MDPVTLISRILIVVGCLGSLGGMVVTVVFGKKMLDQRREIKKLKEDIFSKNTVLTVLGRDRD